MTEISMRIRDGITFKNANLEQAAMEIEAAGRSMVNSTVEIAKVLGRVKTGKLYTDDGYKSVGDFAQKVFGISSASAYKLAQVGERFYNTESKFLKDATEGFTTSNLAEMVGISDDDVLSLVNSGAVTKDTPQAKVREAVSARKAGATKSEIVREYKVSGYEYFFGVATAIDFDRVSMEGLEEAAPADVVKKISAKVDMGETAETLNVWLSANGAVTVFTAEKIPIGKPKVTKAPKFTIEQLKAMLAQAVAEAGE